ncbi:hypothetical protein GOBAR_DD00711 [Gossypium barbadense]|nr:hypothetical protein GOBAR_DD00711 [Gossypium barbadense]
METLENLSNLAQVLKSNILLHAQVVDDPFDAYKVDLDALCDVDMNQLSFDLDKTNTAPADNNEADEDPTDANVASADGLSIMNKFDHYFMTKLLMDVRPSLHIFKAPHANI